MERRFMFHALATGVSASFTLPFNELIEVQSPSALPSTGGYSSSRTENYRYKEILSFRSAVTIATGSFDPVKQAYCTLVTSIIENFNIMGVVTVDRLVARLVSEQELDEESPRVTALGSSFDNLRVAGHTVRAELDHARIADSERPQKSSLACMVRPIELGAHSGLDLVEDGVIQVSQFGRVYLAEIYRTAHYQSITMVRIELGCPVSTGSSATGAVMAGHGMSNGEYFP